LEIEQVIFSHLIDNEQYTRKVLPYIKSEYFHDKSDESLFELINDYVNKYNRIPTKEALIIELNSKDNIKENIFEDVLKKISQLHCDSNTNIDFIVEKTEKFCQDKAIYNALMESISIIDDKKSKAARGVIPDILTKALSVSFDSSIGHDYFEDWEKRFEFYNRKENKIPFGIQMFDEITGGGTHAKTLILFLAGPHVGKSLFMCNFAANNLKDGKNVLYITLEMAEEEISKRIDANLLDIPIDELKDMPKETFEKKIVRAKNATTGKLVVKEYPTAQAGVGNFRHLLVNELKLKKNFKPDIIYIDYLNICASSRVKRGAAGMYEYVKYVGEEIRGLAVEFAVPIISATQTNRDGYKSEDLDMTGVAESFGTTFTADAIFALGAPDTLKKKNQILITQLKNRLGNVEKNNKFVVGVDRPCFKLYDISQDDDDPVMDQGEFMTQAKKISGDFDLRSKFAELS
jgi:replicative DNA helicase